MLIIIKYLYQKKLILVLLNILILLIYPYIQCINENTLNNNIDNIKYDIVIPVNLNDSKILIQETDMLRKFLNYNNMIIIVPNNSELAKEKNNSLYYINEEELVRKEDLITIFNIRGINETKRINWYEQQFLKMSYSRICRNEYYLIWDSDTIPIKHINMFDDGHPIFDMKNEYHYPYFITLERLLPHLSFSKMSYISEHMIIKTEFMNNLLDQIENNILIPGKFFWEKILMSIDEKDILKSGFSEFETYGTYVDTKYPNIYKHRNWFSKRDMVKLFGKLDNLAQNDFIWLAKDYHALTFEKREKFEKKNIYFVKNKEIQKRYRPKRFFKYYKRVIKKYQNKKS